VHISFLGFGFQCLLYGNSASCLKTAFGNLLAYLLGIAIPRFLTLIQADKATNNSFRLMSVRWLYGLIF